MSRDEVAALILVGTLAAWGTSHVLLALKLASVGPRWRGPLALIVLPLAPYWAFRSGLWVRGSTWLVVSIAWLLARSLLAN